MRNATSERAAFAAGVLGMGLVVLVSNLLIGYPISDWLTWGAFSYPLSFLVTDLTNRILGAATARRVIYCGFALGIVLSLGAGEPRIAIASGSAFLFAQLLDVTVFNHFRRQSWWKAPLISTLIASALDTTIFFAGAFAFTAVPWVTLAIGDYMAKLTMAAVLLVPFRLVVQSLPVVWREAPAET